MIGSCLCGAHRFEYDGLAGAITACHCGQCTRLSGHYAASFDADERRVIWTQTAPATEYRTIGGGVRGFCGTCGSKLWFRTATGDFSIEAGAIDGASGGALALHIYVSEKPDYYDLNDDIPHYDLGGEP